MLGSLLTAVWHERRGTSVEAPVAVLSLITKPQKGGGFFDTFAV